MNLLINMPSMRWWNWPLLFMNYQDAIAIGYQGINVTWAIIVYPDEVQHLPEFVRSVEAIPWIKLVVIERDPHRYIVTHKINEALKKLLPSFDGYVWQASDDNLMPRSFMRWFARSAMTGKKILVCSHKRGSGCGETGHGTSDLVAQPESMRIGSVSGEQMLIHSSLHWQDGQYIRPYVEGGCADGAMAERLIKEVPNEFLYTRDFFIPFNALERGRWKAGELKEVLS